MAKRIILGVLALSLIAALAWIIAGDPTTPAPQPAPDAPSAETPTPGTTDLSPAADLVPQAGRQPVVAVEDADAGPTYTLSGVVQFRADVSIHGASIEIYQGDPGDRLRSMSMAMDLQATGSSRPSRRGFKIEGEPMVTAEVSASGHFTIPDLRHRHLRLSLRHDYYALLQRSAIHVEADSNRHDVGRLETYCGGLIRGRILGLDDPKGKEIQAISTLDPMLVVKQPKMFFAAVTNARDQQTHLNAAGEFELAAVMPSPQIKLIHRSRAGYVRSESFGLQPGETREVFLQASPTSHLKVRVRDAAGKPISDARVTASPSDAAFDAMARAKQTQRETTDLEGVARLESLLPGIYTIHVKHPELLDYLGEHQTGDIVVEITLRKGMSISGTVVDKEGKRVADAKIIEVPVVSIPLMGDVTDLVGMGALARGARNSKITSDADGRFEVSGLPDTGTFAFGAFHEDYVGGISSSISPGDDNVEIVLKRAATIRGQVLGREKKPVSNFEVRTSVKLMMVMDRPTSIERIRDSETGEFVMASVPPGTATLRVSAPNYGDFEQRITVVEGEEIDLGVIGLSAAATIRGRVLAPDGLPVAYARVAIKTGGLTANPMVAVFSPQNDCTSDPAGNFELSGLAPGRVTLLAQAKDHASGASNRLTLTQGQVLEGVTITLNSGGSIAGRLILPVGSGAKDWDIFATHQLHGTASSAELDSDLNFRIDHLDPGSYQVQALNMRGFGQTMSTATRETLPGRTPNIGKLIADLQESSVVTRARVREGEVTEVVLDASEIESEGTTLICKVWVGSEPMQNGYIEIQDVTGTQPRISMAIVTDGEMRLGGLQPGVIQMQARSGITLGPLGDAHSIEIPKGVYTHHCEWHIPGGSISGTVLNANDNVPIAGAMIRIRSSAQLREGRDQDFGFALSDHVGKFSFEGLAAGTYSLIAQSVSMGSGGNSGARLDGLELAANSSLTDMVLRVEPGAGISVQVMGPDGSPVKGALILAVDGEGQAIGGMPIARSNAKGEAWLSGMTGGNTRVVARASGLAPAVSILKQVLPGQYGEFRVDLSTGTEVTVKLIDRSGSTLTGARLSVRWPGSPWLTTALLAPRRLADGSLDLGPLPVGEIEFSISHPRIQFTARRLIPRGKKATLVISPE